MNNCSPILNAALNFSASLFSNMEVDCDLKPLTDEQVFYDKFLCDKFYLLVCMRNFDNFFYDKCTCPKASMRGVEQVHLS